MGILNKLFGFGKKPKEPSFSQKPISKVKKERERTVNVGQSIFPVIKDANDPKIAISQNTNPIIMDPFVDGLVVCYLLDTGGNFELISQKHLRDWGLTKENIIEVAMRNLKLKINENLKVGSVDLSKTLPKSKPFFRVDFDANLNTSMMLIDEFWDTKAQEITKSNLVAVSIPAKNLMFFTDLRLMESFRTMLPVADQMYESSIADGIALSKNTYFRSGGKWIKFLDTGEQMVDYL